ncbi:MAG: EF-hand domain-containing protein [Alphaproteobacteria bacterium]|nr:EF-hand domain-containing protein [Alphaproteobacteria bacterium]
MGQEPNKPESGFDLLPLVFFVTFVLLMAGVGFTRQGRHEPPVPTEPQKSASVEAEDAPKPKFKLMDYGNEKPYPYLEAIPEKLWIGIEPGVSYENYLEEAARSVPEGGENLRKAATRVFKTLDKNLDGVISEEEYAPAVKIINLKKAEGSLREGIAELDLNGDGGLSRKEFREARRTNQSSVLEPILSTDFNHLDRNQDKSVSAGEILKEIKRVQEYEKHMSIGRPKVKIPTTCGFGEDVKLPEDTVVYGVGGYGNGMMLDFPIDQSGGNARLVDLVVNEPEYPVALILGQYEPTVWHIRRTPETKIVAVYLTGYHRQAASALERDVALKSSIYNDSGEGSCGYVPFWGEDKANLDFLAIQIYGRRAEDYGAIAKDGTAIVGGENFDRARLVHSRRNPPESYKLEGVPAAGRAGIAEAVDKGYIRPVTTTDQIAWVEKITDYAPDDPAAAEFLRKIEEDPGGQYMQMIWGEAYVVVRDDFTYPPGLYGGNSSIFIIPDGVKRPKGDPGHSAVYDFRTMRCYGPQCM